MSRPTTFKLAEKFYSVEGEGLWAGTPMCFLRTHSCPVGGTAGICVDWQGHQFVCDTGNAYKGLPGKSRAEWHSYDEHTEDIDAVAAWKWALNIYKCRHLVLTGGEPLIYDIDQLAQLTPVSGKLHIETSATENQCDIIRKHRDKIWLTVSPKRGFIEEVVSLADEIKLLVYRSTQPSAVLKWAEERHPKGVIYLQPIEAASQNSWREAVAKAVEIAKLYPQLFRVSTQIHKYLGVR